MPRKDHVDISRAARRFTAASRFSRAAALAAALTLVAGASLPVSAASGAAGTASGATPGADVTAGAGAASSGIVPAAAAGMKLVLSGPASAGVGQPFVVQLIARNARNLAGYEAELRFDPKALAFGGAQQRTLGLAATGRGVESLGDVERPDGVTIGAWSCATRDCVTRQGPRATTGASGTVTIARISFTALKAGRIHITLGRTVLVDPAGNALKMAAAAAGLSVTSGRNAGGVIAAPARVPDATLINPAPSAVPAARDLTQDGLVSHADAMDAVVAWTRVREANAICGAAAKLDDVSGDGCLDVSDVQRIAGSLAPHGAERAPRSTTGSTGPATLPTGSIVVNSVADDPDATPGDGICATASGACTLRAAIVEANLASGPDTIDFAIPGAGVHTIALGSPLPAISDESGGTTIDGYTQPGASVNTADPADNARLMVEVTGNTSMDGMTITSAGNVVRGLSFWAFHRAIWITGAGASANRIVGDFVGENAAATYFPPVFVNLANGVSINGGAASNQVGDTNLADRNLISGNAHNGVWFYDEGSDHNLVLNNIIGLSPDGTAARRNIGRGVDVNAMASFNRIGGNGTLERNVLSGNSAEGIEFSHNRMTDENRAVGNFIGTNLTGEAAPAYAADGWSGIHFEDGVTENYAINNVIGGSGCVNTAGGITLETHADGNIITGNHIGISRGGASLANCNWGVVIRLGATRTQVGPGNVIADNPVGVFIDGTDTQQNTVSQNSIFGNAGLGIDLGPSVGVTPNDPGDADSGPNTILNFPVLVSATTALVSGTACAGCTVEFFGADGPVGNPGQGKAYLASTTADPTGAFSLSIASLSVGDVITATATDSQGDTSEFAANVAVASGESIAASDGFGRTVSNGWGAADAGGAWTSLSGTAADYAVNGNFGTMRLISAGNSRGQQLASVSLRDVDLTVQLGANKAPAGGAQYFYAVVRRQGGDEYRAKLRLDPSGTVAVAASRFVAGVEKDLGPAVTVPIPQGATMQFRVEALGVNPTTVRLRAWVVGDPEPTTWAASYTDSSPTLQGPGAVGLRVYLATGTTNGPVTFSFDGFLATTPGASPPPPPPPPPPSSLLASDAFGRTVTGTWGRADIGGTWAVATNAPDYNVDGSHGTMLLSGPGISRAAFLAGVSGQDVDIAFHFTTSALGNGNGTFAYGVVRRVSGGTEYRLKIRLTATGTAYLQATRAVHGVETALGSEVKVPNFVYHAGQDVWVHGQVSGTSPTTLSFRAWLAGSPEPSTWQYTVTDSTAALQAAGGVGLRAYLAVNTTNGPITVSFDDFAVNSL